MSCKMPVIWFETILKSEIPLEEKEDDDEVIIKEAKKTTKKTKK